jgi:hypothetical protein
MTGQMGEDRTEPPYPAPWRKDWPQVPCEGWVWVADTDGEVMLRRAAAVRARKDQPFDLHYEWLAWAKVDMPSHPADLEDIETGTMWLAGTTWRTP